jgi:hypothetical protein
MELLKNLLGQKNWISINRTLVINWGLDATYLFSHLLDMFDYFENKNELIEGWFFATSKDVHDYCGLGRKVQDSAIDFLCKIGVLHQKLMGMPAKRHFKFSDNSAEIVIDWLKRTNKIVSNGQTRLSQTDKQDCPKRTNKIVPNGHEITITNKQEQITITKEEKSDFLKKSHTPAKNENLDLDNSNKFAMIENSPEILEAEKLIMEAANEASTPIDANDILKQPTPEGINVGVFSKLRIFGIARQKGAKSNRMTKRAWSDMILDCVKASKNYEPQSLLDLIDYSTGRKHKSPFFVGYQDVLQKIASSPVVAKNAITVKIENEKPFEDAEKEESFNRTINSIKEKFEFIKNSKCQIRQINRKEFAELFGLGANKAISNFIFKNGKNGLWKMYCDALLSLAADRNLNFDNRTLYSILLDAFKKANDAKKNG